MIVNLQTCVCEMCELCLPTSDVEFVIRDRFYGKEELWHTKEDLFRLSGCHTGVMLLLFEKVVLSYFIATDNCIRCIE